jgi:hypothetical protein
MRREQMPAWLTLATEALARDLIDEETHCQCSNPSHRLMHRRQRRIHEARNGKIVIPNH